MQALDLFQRLFRDKEPEQYVEVMTIEREGEVKKYYFTSLDDAATFANGQPAGLDVYFGVLPRIRQSSEAGAVVDSGQWFWCDFDDDDRIREGLWKIIPPTVTIFSGRGLHCYWELGEPVSVDILTRTMKRCAILFGADGACANQGRHLRVPGTFNQRTVGDGREMKQCGIVDMNDRIYDLAQLQLILSLKPETLKRVRTGSLRGYGQDRSKRDFGVVMQLVRLGASDETITRLFDDNPSGIGDKHFLSGNGSRYLIHTLERARQKEIEDSSEDPMSADDLLFEQTADRTTRFNGTVVATFVVKPQRLIRAPDGDSYVVDIESERYEERNMVLPKQAFKDRSSLLKILLRDGMSWVGNSDPVIRLFGEHIGAQLALLNPTPITGVTCYGLHGPTIVVPGNRNILPNGPAEPDQMQQFYVGPQRSLKVQYRFDTPLDQVRQLVQTLHQQLPLVNDPAAIWPIIGWIWACGFKPLLSDRQFPFPILNVYGRTGSGKTSLLLRVIFPLVGCTDNSFSLGMKRFGLIHVCASSNMHPVSLTEYRESLMKDPEGFIRTLLETYDGTTDVRGRSDQGLNEYPLITPMCISGEDEIHDMTGAADARIVYANLRSETFEQNPGMTAAFEQLRHSDLSALSGHYALFVLNTDVWPFHETALELVKQSFPAIRDRQLNNFAIILTGILLFEEFCRQAGCTARVIDREFVQSVFAHRVAERMSSPVPNNVTLEFVIETLNNVLEDPAGAAIKIPHMIDRTTDKFAFYVDSAYRYWRDIRGRSRLRVPPATTMIRNLNEAWYTVDQARVIPWRSGTRYPMIVIDLAALRKQGLTIPMFEPAAERRLLPFNGETKP